MPLEQLVAQDRLEISVLLERPVSWEGQVRLVIPEQPAYLDLLEQPELEEQVQLVQLDNLARWVLVVCQEALDQWDFKDLSEEPDPPDQSVQLEPPAQ